MACECDRTSDDVRMRLAENAAMCCVCPFADDPGIRAVNCTVHNTPIADRVRGTCPRGFHPVEGIVTWLGIRWYGVPYPVRVWLWIVHPSHRRPSWWPGCGCIKFLKDWTGKRAQVGVH